MTRPKQYEEAKYADVPKEVRGLFEKIKETRRGIYMHGAIGCGKTHAAWALAQQWEENGGRHPLFWNVSELIRSIKKDFDKHPYDREKEEEYIMEHRGLLFLDDLGAERATDFVADTLYLIVNRRYEERLPVIVTSNMDIGELSDRVGDRIASRIAGMCDVVEMKGEDRRLA